MTKSDPNGIVILLTQLLNCKLSAEPGPDGRNGLERLIDELTDLLGISEQDEFNPQLLCHHSLVGPAGCLRRALVERRDQIEAQLINPATADPKELQHLILAEAALFASAVQQNNADSI